jgi:hypothetical protein
MVATRPVDFRKGAEGLSALVREIMAGVPAVRLHTIARLPWDQRRRHHRALVAERPDQAIKTIASRAGFITEVDAVKPVGDPP